MNRPLHHRVRAAHVLPAIAVFAISAGILLAAQSGWIGTSPAGTDGSYGTPDARGLYGYDFVQAAGGMMQNLGIADQIGDVLADVLADVPADMLFTGVLDAAYAVHGTALRLVATDKINDTHDLILNGASGITTFTTGGHTYVAVASHGDHGVQILDVTDPDNVTAAGNITAGDTLKLNGASGITTFTTDTHTYVAVASHGDNGVQILDVTDPDNVTGVFNLHLDDARDITTFDTGGHTYVATTLNYDAVHILDVTDPSTITVAGSIDDYGVLGSLYGITTFGNSTHTYVAVASHSKNGVHILDVTDPSTITAAGSITDDDDLILAKARGITTFGNNTHTYVAVASYGDNGVQILDVTDPSTITAAGSITDDDDLILAQSYGITTFTTNTHTYVAVTSTLDNGVQILDVTDPGNVTAAGSIQKLSGNTHELAGAQDITTFGNSTHTYAAVASYGDSGVQILRVDGIGGSDTTTPDTPPDSTHFVTTWNTTSSNEAITFPGRGTYTINWGDGYTTTVTNDATHTYASAGTHKVRAYGGLESFSTSSEPSNALKLQSIERWGDIEWTTMRLAFNGAHNMLYEAADNPDFSGVTDTGYMFGSAKAFNGDLSEWDVSGVNIMTSMFSDTDTFNGDISDWDVSNVTKMANMFSTAKAFNGDISSWNVSSVTNMKQMFSSAATFNRDISNWDVSSVTDMQAMFQSAKAFNGDISNWDVSSVINMTRMFYSAGTFNSDISNWDVSSVINMTRMFSLPGTFNQNLGNWYIVPDSYMINLQTGRSDSLILAQNAILVNHLLTYNLSSVGDSQKFDIQNGFLVTKPNEEYNVESTYQVTITATGPNLFGMDNQRTVDVTVTETVQSGDTNAGDGELTVSVSGDRSVREGDTGMLESRVRGVDTPTYAWSADPALLTFGSQNSSKTSFTALSVGEDVDIQVTLKINGGADMDNGGEDSIWVTVKNNRPPTVDAGSGMTVNERTAVTLSGSASDPDDDAVTYQWVQKLDSSVDLTGASTARLQFTAPGITSNTKDLTFELTVTDDRGDTSYDDVTITVRDVPLAVSSASYRSGTITITFNQDVLSPDYSKMYVRDTGENAGGIQLLDASDKSHSGRTITATLDSGQKRAIRCPATPAALHRARTR